MIVEGTSCSKGWAAQPLSLGNSLWKAEFLMRRSQQQGVVEPEERELAGPRGDLPGSWGGIAPQPCLKTWS